MDKSENAYWEEHNSLCLRLYDERKQLSFNLAYVDIERLISSGVSDEEIAALYRVPVEDVDLVYRFERNARAQVLRSARRILHRYEDTDYLDDEFHTGNDLQWGYFNYAKDARRMRREK